MLQALRVLVVDDNVDAASTMVILLKTQACEVRAAHDGPTALNVVREFRPHLILLDVGMPMMSGYEVARKVREDRSLGHIVLVAITGYGQKTDKLRALDAGIDYHLVKPADFNDVQKIVDKVAAEMHSD